MAVVHDWECIEHGAFEGSHPICPNFGCESRSVVKVFLKAPGYVSGKTRRTDAGLRKSADMYKIGNFKSVRQGEVAFDGRADKNLGQEVLWGNDVQKKMGHSFSELTSIAQKPLEVPGTNLRLDKNNGMRDAANEIGITKRKLPAAGEVIAYRGEKGAKSAAESVAQ